LLDSGHGLTGTNTLTLYFFISCISQLWEHRRWYLGEPGTVLMQFQPGLGFYIYAPTGQSSVAGRSHCSSYSLYPQVLTQQDASSLPGPFRHSVSGIQHPAPRLKEQTPVFFKSVSITNLTPISGVSDFSYYSHPSVAPRTTPVIAEIRPVVGLGLPGLGLPESVLNCGKPGALFCNSGPSSFHL
jgi:hypothetical protein